MKLTYDKLVLKSWENGVEEVIDANNGGNSLDPVEKILSNVIGKSLTVVIASGKVKLIDGTEAITKEIVASIGNIDVQTKQRVESQISGLLGEKFINNNVLEMFGFFPDSAVQINNSWTRTNVLSAGVEYELTTRYKLAAINSQTLQINVDGNIKALNSPGSTTLAQSAAKIQGEQEGYIEIDKLSGVLLKSKHIASMSGTISVMGKEVPLEIRVEKEVVGKSR